MRSVRRHLFKRSFVWAGTRIVPAVFTNARRMDSLIQYTA